jgi:hypothetical protein
MCGEKLIGCLPFIYVAEVCERCDNRGSVAILKEMMWQIKESARGQR